METKPAEIIILALIHTNQSTNFPLQSLKFVNKKKKASFTFKDNKKEKNKPYFIERKIEPQLRIIWYSIKHLHGIFH